MKATAKDLRFRTKSVLACVARGEAVTLTYRGHLVARIVPAEHGIRRKAAELDGFGLWKDRPDMADPAAWVREQRKARR